jgi:cysteinyl-tRNA synthetase
VSRFEEYGKLSRQPLEELVQSRVEPNPDKRNPGDFVLWKASKPREPAWKSPWMPGRPGWHIEDTAITEKHLGAQYDLHGGGQDLIFPHHEAEIAQMESLSGKPLCRYWLHNGFVTINGEKMSKSLGNFTTAKDLLVRYDPEAIRLFVVSSHYHDPIDYTLQRLEAARNTLQRLRDCLANLDDALPKARPGAAPGEAVKMVEDLTRQFEKGMDDDFNTPEALKALHALRDYANEYLASKGRTRGGLELIRGRYLKLANALGLLERAAPGLPSGVTEEWVLAKIEEREKARKKKDFKGADAVREELRRKGILVDDTAEGPRWKVAVLPSPARGAR